MTRFAKVFLDCSRREKAERLVSRVITESEGLMRQRTIEPDRETGFIAICDIEVIEVSWPMEILRLLMIAQRLGRGWILSGSIEEELDLWCNSTSIAGVTAINIVVSNDTLHPAAP